MHKETPKERAVALEASEKFAVAHVLVGDAAFQQKATKVAEIPDSDRAAAALREAKDYAMYRGPAQDAIADLLRRLAEGSSDDPAHRMKVSNAGTSAFWAEEALEPQDALRQRQRLTVSNGAELLRRRGAGLCLACKTPLSDRWERVFARRSRRDYCASCGSSQRQSSDRGAITAALEVLSGQRATRRARRRR